MLAPGEAERTPRMTLRGVLSERASTCACAQTLRNAATALCPPNPKELLMAM